jgi:hypothetical protein
MTINKLAWCALLLIPGLFFGGCDGPATSALSSELGPAASDQSTTVTGDGDSKQGPPGWIRAALVQPRGLIRNRPEASPGYVLFTQLTSDTAYLIDLDGRVVHTWATDLAADAGYLLDDGSLVRQARIAEPENFKAGGVSGYLQRVSWDGDVLWQWRMGDAERILHHDLEILPNGNILVIAWEQIDAADARAAGRRADLIPEQGLWADWVLEVEPVPPDDARIVWEWHVWDHLVQNHDPAAPNFGDPAAHPRRLDVNGDGESTITDEEELEQLKALGYIPDDATPDDMKSDFLHMNALDYHPGLDQVALSVPEVGEIWIIDHSTSAAEARSSSGGRSGHGGDLLYRWGNPRTYGRGGDADQFLFYQHQVLWIPDGWPNGGNLTVFNNGGDRGWSSVMEIEPPLEDDGSYALGPDQPWGPPTPRWTYVAPERASFYAPFISGAHRLANGNTFICSGPQGWFFEVTPGGEIVWEYRNPYHGGVPGWHPPATKDVPYASFRATKIPPDHPALVGRDLRPLDPQPEPYRLPAPQPTGGP